MLGARRLQQQQLRQRSAHRPGRRPRQRRRRLARVRKFFFSLSFFLPFIPSFRLSSAQTFSLLHFLFSRGENAHLSSLASPFLSPLSLSQVGPRLGEARAPDGPGRDPLRHPVPRPPRRPDGRPRGQDRLDDHRAGRRRAHHPLVGHGRRRRLRELRGRHPARRLRLGLPALDRPGRRGLQPHRLPRHAQGVVGRRGQGDPQGRLRRGGARRLRGRQGRGARLADLCDEAGAAVAPPRGAAARRRARERDVDLLARLLRPAPPPEDRGGGPRVQGPRGDAPRDGAVRARAGQGGRLRRRRDR
jgi:hypothetical protein